PLTKVGRNESLAMHQRNVQMFERRYRTTAAVSRQTCHRSTLEQEGQQLGFLEYASDQLAVLEVVISQRRLVLGEHAVDFIHSLVRRADCLAFAQQRLRDVLQAERREAPGGRAQRFDTINDQAPGRRREKVMAATVLTPFHLFAATPQAQRYFQMLSVVTQN